MGGRDRDQAAAPILTRNAAAPDDAAKRKSPRGIAPLQGDGFRAWEVSVGIGQAVWTEIQGQRCPSLHIYNFYTDAAPVLTHSGHFPSTSLRGQNNRITGTCAAPLRNPESPKYRSQKYSPKMSNSVKFKAAVLSDGNEA